MYRSGPALDMTMCHPATPKTYPYRPSNRTYRLQAGGARLRLTSIPEEGRTPGKGRIRRRKDQRPVVDASL